MTTIYGVDGCKSRWIVIEKNLNSHTYRFHLWATSELFHSHPIPQVIAIDIPIGLPDQGSRECDIDARKRLGKRASSVFRAPIRPILKTTSRQEADRISSELDNTGISFQTFGIIPKIREVDDELHQNPELQTRVWEVHPEISFYFLAHEKPMDHYKKTVYGFEERYQILKPVFGKILYQAVHEFKTHAGRDDILDAFAALWTAERILSGSFEMIPSTCPKDSFGLRMTIAA